ncbi:MAG: class I SAM-dependent rRNA methyltransferase [Flectobacillus sp.]|uniref:class I SAM-dependent rRNA methyltransferase n=1 Tax=Flectobacillus sp. TaxID=50419 RepID=UPI003B9D4BF8
MKNQFRKNNDFRRKNQNNHKSGKSTPKTDFSHIQVTQPAVILHVGKEFPVKRFHPWVFSGAIAQILGEPTDGQVVDVLDFEGNFLATGHYHEGSIAVKIFSFEKTEADEDFWFNKIAKAFDVRKLIDFNQTNCFRLIHGEGDGCPGLIVDVYNGVAVLQAHSIGMHLERHKLANAIKRALGDTLVAVYDKSSETLPPQYAANQKNGYLIGTSSVPHPAKENGHTFLINWETGQKTGFFLDQRDNRALLARYAKDRKVLNSFCYSGGFSIYALNEGATLVHSVDVSQKAIDLVNQNVEANFGDKNANNHEAYAEDVMKYLKANDQFYDLIVLDPPAYAKSMDARHRAVQGYKRLNMEGFKRLGKGGILFTFSCSQVVDRELFYNTVVSAALEAGRQVRVLHHLTQPSDHPVNFFHPEGSYLKGLVLYVE